MLSPLQDKKVRGKQFGLLPASDSVFSLFGGVTWLMVTLEWGTFVGKEACGCVVEFHSVQEVLGIQIWTQI